MLRIALILLQAGGPADKRAFRTWQADMCRAQAGSGVAGWLRRLQAGKGAALQPVPPYALDDLAFGLEQALWDQGTLKVFASPHLDPAILSALAGAVAAWQATEMVVLPLDPLFTPWRNGGALQAWQQASADAGLGSLPARTLCCHPTDPMLLRALIHRLQPHLVPDKANGPLPLVMVLAPWPLGREETETGPWQARQLVRELALAAGLPADRIWLAQASPRGMRLSGAVPGLDLALQRLAGQRVVALGLAAMPPDLQERAAAARVDLVIAGQGDGPLLLADDVERLAHLVRQMRVAPPGIRAAFGRRQCPSGLTDCPYPLVVDPAMR